MSGDWDCTEEGIYFMAISTDRAILAILKTWYKDGVENLLKRNSPALQKIGTTKVEGKEQRFAAIYSRGGAVSADATVAAAVAAQNAKNAEFVVTPGQIFSYFSFNAKEVQASLTRRGAYMKVAGNKSFAAAEAFRKTLAAALYGRGYGELAVLGAAYTMTTAPIDITLPNYAIMAIDVGSQLVLKSSVKSTTEAVTLTVNSIDGNTVNVTPSASYSALATDVVALKGSMDANGAPNLPMGLAGWLPILEGRDAAGSSWPTYIATPFFGVTRSVNPEALAGSFVPLTASEPKLVTLQKAIQKARRHGAVSNFIIMNDEDWLDVSNALETTNSFMTLTSEKGKKTATKGFSNLQFAMSTSWVDNVYDDPYCPKGVFYVLDADGVELFAYTNSEIAHDGLTNNEPGKQNPEEFDDKGKEDNAFKLMIDDVLSVVPGQLTSDGESVRACYQLFGSFVVLNPSNAAVGIFSDANTATLPGYVD